MENIIKGSFFDQKNYIQTEEERNLIYVRNSKSFWLDNKKGDVKLNTMFAYVSDEVLMESILWKRSKKQGKKQHYYRLYKDRLERYDNEV